MTDECDVAEGVSQDCNENGIPDSCDIDSGESSDFNMDGILSHHLLHLEFIRNEPVNEKCNRV